MSMISEFKEFITLQRGFDLPKRKMKGGKIPVIGSNCIIGYHNESKVNPPGVITGRSGTLGIVQYVDVSYWPHNTSLWVKDFKGNVPKFVYYKLKMLNLERFNGGASVPTLNRNVLDTIRISIPDIKKQKKISDILSAYDDLIENNRRRIQLLEHAARLLYREWFVHLRFPGHENVKIKACPGLRSGNGIPEGWERKSVADLGKIITGKTPSKKNLRNFDGNIPFIKTPDMHKSPIIIKTEETLSEIGAESQKNKYLSPWSIQVSCIGTVGVVTMNLSKAQTNQQINSVVSKKEIYRYYSYFCLSRLKPLLKAIGGGATMANVNKKKFENLNVLIPNETILQEYHKKVDSSFRLMATLLRQNQKLAEARDILLPRLMNGEIAV